MTHRPWFLGVLAAAAFLTPAGATPSCPLLTSAPGGDTVATVDDPVPDPALDLRSADVASDRTRLTVVIRVAKLTLPPKTSPTGVMYDMWLQLDEHDIGLHALSVPAMPDRFFMYANSGTTSAGPLGLGQAKQTTANVTGVFDTARNEIRMTVPLADIDRVAPLRHVLVARDFTGRSYRAAWGPADQEVASQSDIILGGRASYRLGTRSCIKVG